MNKLTINKERIYAILLVTILVVVPYFLLQNFQINKKIIEVPALAIDQFIPFVVHTFWVYQSLYILLILVALTIKSKAVFYRYAKGIVAVSLVCNLFFLLMPTTCPRPTNITNNAAYNLFIQYEKPLNAFPSMHVAFAIFTLMFCFNHLSEVSMSLSLIAWWTFAICISTLFLKQHYVVDVLAGSIIGVFINKFNYSKNEKK